ncbi:copper-binding protein [Citrobacter amalonaticus]|uniref:Copper-binding protein n=1 Tax=Citrobacter amalonaticus TaxID=35703 RepID=A0A2S4S059_CITAM|nr:cation efflux system protein CusF [Citrobacter amalonaticus]POT58297.1 copper-binding protein [Citrobacter amalonaticus]POT76178.1 copper-binding protein [Citrobacter amalonaticus]POU66824.1 copper-binding protein [Citrobacter amalonaticus]POV05413.1 copper-binding protein [Citrobacter amalonaticus]
MRNVLKMAIFAGLAAGVFTVQAAEHHHGEMMNAMPAAEQSQVINATGVIKAIDMENKKITIEHEPIPAMNWPAMTMRFTITPQTQQGDIKPGDKVTFHFIQQGNLSLLQDIQSQ